MRHFDRSNPKLVRYWAKRDGLLVEPPPPPRSPPIPRWRRCLQWVALSGLGALVVAYIVVFLIVLPLTSRDMEPDPASSPSPSYVPVSWSYQGAGCADGSGSAAIGKRGACSHHGGVVGIYIGSNGTWLACGGHDRPPGRRAQQEQLRDIGRLVCTNRP